MLVVDLGCADHGKVFSLRVLAEMYEPDRIFGFDPSTTQMRVYPGTPVTFSHSAAWLYDGEIAYNPAGLSSKIGEGAQTVPCFDFSRWMRHHAGAVVKMDIEGAEYPLLNRMIADGTDALMSELLVEWHGGCDGEELTSRLCCRVKHWEL